MRFFKDGPSIPDDLLIARDEGRVVFFCGAGVSRARAGLPDFFGLADQVISKLRVPPDHPARRILIEAREMETRGLGGLISADHVFGLIARDFVVPDIEAAVASSLRPADGVHLSAHRILLDLATTPERKVRLVTTNFERLFEACNDSLRAWQPPRLPDPSRHSEMDGVIHLHGCTTVDYSGAEGDGFILSSADFGRAYLSDAWATEFFREILARYVVVFVGYAADDPPVQYLLEALNMSASRLHGAYAFQAGLTNAASGRWLHKGVEAIPYSESDGHRALWETLSAWAERAKSPDEWFNSVIDMANRGPDVLQPHERGQVAHTIYTVEGARRFSSGDVPPPAEWLCVFDPFRRYATPSRTGRIGEAGPIVDPFDLYGLDSDLEPPRIPPEDHYPKRERYVPPSAWDGFAANRLDKQSLRDDTFSAIRGHWAKHFPRLAPRLSQLAVWIGRIADQPASVWWAAHQQGLHPDIQDQIRWELKRSKKDISPVIRNGWQYLFEAWEENQRDLDSDLYELKQATDRNGWNRTAVREYAAISRPHLKAGPRYWGGPVPPVFTEDMRLEDLMRLEVVYADAKDEPAFPDEWLAFAVRELRKNLEHALQLETELGGYRLEDMSPIIPGDGVGDDDHYMRAQGLSGSVILFASLFERLLKLNGRDAKNEFTAWPANDDTIFARLRIWASGYSDLVPAESFDEIIAELSDAAFWNSYHQRDLLLVLAKRWDELPELTCREIETRLLHGRPKWNRAESNEFEKRRAWLSLNRLWWLANNGCGFTFDLEAETQRLKRIVPEWDHKNASKAAESLEAHGGWVRTETEHSSLLNEPVNRILDKALELSGRTDDFLIEKDPFAGLSTERPLRALSALSQAAKHDQYPEWAWRTFLNQNRRSDRGRLSAVIAERISRFPNQAVVGFIAPASDWLLDRSEQLASDCPVTFDRIVSKLIEALRSQAVDSANRPNNERDWTMEAINAPAGKIAKALFNDPRKDGLERRGGFPADWLRYVDDLLSLGGHHRCHALVIFAHNMDWFYAIDPHWTEANMLAPLDNGTEPDRSAIWSGFLWGGRVRHQELFLKLKPSLLTFAKQRSRTGRQYSQVLAPMILAGWGSSHSETGERIVSNDEMHDVLLNANEEFRAQLLWQVEIWSKKEDDDTGEEWSAKIVELLRDAWPRQKSLKTPRTSAALCDLAFTNADHFLEISEIILPLLTRIEGDRFVPYDLLESKDNIVDKYPQSTLAILYRVLPDDVSAWPYSTGDILDRIGEADSTLRVDERLLELNRKWNSR